MPNSLLAIDIETKKAARAAFWEIELFEL